MPADNLFAPYKVLSQSSSSLHLKAHNGVKVIRFVFLLAPLMMLVMGFVLYKMEGNVQFLYLLGGVAVLELIAFSFIKLPADVQMDRMGFSLQRISLRGSQQADYLWTDVDRLRQRLTPTKYGQALSYQAMLKTGKKLNVLSFGAYNPKKQSADDINALLRAISGKEIEVKA